MAGALCLDGEYGGEGLDVLFDGGTVELAPEKGDRLVHHLDADRHLRTVKGKTD